jgi:uncharacterized membrane protein YidH (DUF202 family)
MPSLNLDIDYFTHPVGFRFVLALLLVGSGFLVLVKGWEYFDNQRRFLGSTLIGLGVMLSIIGFGQWLLW